MRVLPIDCSDALCLATSLLVALAALGARSRYWRMVPSLGEGEARAPSFLSRLNAFATELVRSLPSPQDRAYGFVGSCALLGSLSGSLSGALSGGLNARLSGGLSGGLGGVLGKWLPPERSPHGRVVGRTLGEPCRQPFGWQRARRPAWGRLGAGSGGALGGGTLGSGCLAANLSSSLVASECVECGGLSGRLDGSLSGGMSTGALASALGGKASVAAGCLVHLQTSDSSVRSLHDMLSSCWPGPAVRTALEAWATVATVATVAAVAAATATTVASWGAASAAA